MKNMLRMAFLSSLLVTSSLSAVEVGLLVDKQFGKAKAVEMVGLSGEYDAVKPGGMGFRVGVGLLDLKVAELGVAFTYHPKAKEDFSFEGHRLGDYETEYMALGVQADWKFLVNLHAGVDIRREKYTISNTGLLNRDGTTDVTRPWLKAGIGFSIPTPILSPFVRLEVAMAATKSDDMNDNNELRKALAPNYQIGLYGGIRF